MSPEKQKVAIVTGAARGIGAVIAERLARDGFAVAVNHPSGPADAEALVRKIQSAGGRALAVKADVADPAATRGMFDLVEKELGGVDVLVNNAGLMRTGPLAQVDDATFDQMVSVNLKGTFNTLREAATRMRDGGRIINLSSSVASIRQPGYAIYGATKAAVEVLTTILSKELGSRGIRVNAVAPGPTATHLLENSRPEIIDHLVKTTPLGRLGTPEDIASVVSFLAGPDAGWVDGQTLRVNGGVI